MVAPDHVKGYIYVEAYKQTHVKSAIEGIGNLRMGLWNQQMVPIKEMTDVLKVVKEVTNLKPKSWVRLKRGLYKDDIAQVPNPPGVGSGGRSLLLMSSASSVQVDYVEPSQNTISLKMIPRIDLDRIKAKMSLVWLREGLKVDRGRGSFTPVSLFLERLVCQEKEVQEAWSEAVRCREDQVGARPCGSSRSGDSGQ